MAKYKFLEDKSIAEAVFTAYGRDLAELFVNAAATLELVIVDLNTVEEKISRKIELEEENLDELLLALLERLVYLKDAESLIFKRFEVLFLDSQQFKLEILCYGDIIKPLEQKLAADVKAVTRHNFAIKRTGEGHEATITLDI